MASLIEDNNFANDSLNTRNTRLYQLSHNIDTYALELDLEAAMLAWAQDAYDLWQAARGVQLIEQAEKDEAFETAQTMVEDLRLRYQALKELVIARYPEGSAILNEYGVNKTTPDSVAGLQEAAYALLHGNASRLTKADPNALPLGMTLSLQTLYNDSYSDYNEAFDEDEDALQSTLSQAEIYDTDSKKLRAIYQWIVAYWDKYDPRLIELGFAMAQVHGGGYPEAPANLAWVLETDTFSWDAVTDATSYQLVYREYGTTEFEEAYVGEDVSVVFDPGAGQWEFKVRARNVNGYGDFGALLLILIPGGLSAPENVLLVYFPEPSDYLQLTWDAVAGATGYKLYQSIVLVGQPAGPFASLEFLISSPHVINNPLAGHRYYYNLTAYAPGEVSEHSATVFVDVV